MKKTIKALKIEIEAIKKTQTEGILEMKICINEQEPQTKAQLTECKGWEKDFQALKV